MDPSEDEFLQNWTTYESSYHYQQTWKYHSHSIARSVSIVFGIVSNVAILLVLGVKLRLRRFSHSVMLSLACADVTYLLVNATLNYQEYFNEVPRPICVAIAFLTDLRMFVYCGTLLLVAVQHNCTIVHARRITPQSCVHLSFAIIWLVSMAICFGMNVLVVNNSDYSQPSEGWCVVDSVFQRLMELVLVPLLVIVTLICLHFLYFRPLKLLRDQSPSVNCMEMNSLLTDLVVTAVFYAFCFGNLFILAMYSFGKLDVGSGPHVLYIFTNFSSTAANCVIYVALNQEFRKALQSLLTC